MKKLSNITLGLSPLVLVGTGLIYAAGNNLLLTMGWTAAFGGPNATDAASPMQERCIVSLGSNRHCFRRPGGSFGGGNYHGLDYSYGHS